jgi:hypothetical protein
LSSTAVRFSSAVVSASRAEVHPLAVEVDVDAAVPVPVLGVVLDGEAGVVVRGVVGVVVEVGMGVEVGVAVVGRVVGVGRVVVGAVVGAVVVGAAGVVVPARGTENASSTGPHALLAAVRALLTAVSWAVVSEFSCTWAVRMLVAVVARSFVSCVCAFFTPVAREVVSSASWSRALCTAVFALSTPCWAVVIACWSCCFFTSVGPLAACS